MTRLACTSLALAFFVLASVAGAQDKVDPTGTWKWKQTRNNQEFEQTLKLKLEGDKLTGALLGRNNQETAIEEGKYKDGEVSFAVTRERNGTKFTTKYAGKLKDDTITGKTTTERDGQKQERDWEAKREKAAK